MAFLARENLISSSLEAASFNSFLIGICCGQRVSHLPQEMQQEALLCCLRKIVHCIYSLFAALFPSA